MSEDLTKTVPQTDSEKLTLILTTVQSLTVRANNIDSRLGRVEQTVHDTQPILQKVVADIGQLHEGQVEMRGEISQLRQGQVEMRADISQVRQGQVEMRAEISQLREGQVEGRAEILQLHEGQRALSTEVRALRRDIDHRFGDVYTKLVQIEIDHRDVHDRVTRLELNSNPPNTQT